MNQQTGQFNSSHNNVLIIILAVVITALVVGGGVFLWQRAAINELTNFTTSSSLEEPFTYTKNDQLFSVSKKEFNISDQFTALTLADQSRDCGTNKTEQYFDALLSKYANNDKGVEYDFHYLGQTQDSGIWIVMAIPNKLNYADINDFKNDFDICAAGAHKYPYLVSEKYLLFDSSCGSGFDDGSGKPHGCDAVKEAVRSIIKLQ